MAKKTSKKVSHNNSKKVSEEKSQSKMDFSKINWGLVKKILPVILILVVMFVAFQVRSGPINLDGLRSNVQATTYANVKNIISQQINQQYPDLSSTYKQQLVDKQYNQVISSGEINISGHVINLNQAISQNLQSIKEAFKAPNGQTYLNAIDPYDWLMLARWYHLNGYQGNKIVNGTPMITLQLAPNGVKGSFTPTFQVWIESFIFGLNGINQNSTVGQMTKTIYLLPVIFAMLCVIPAFFIIRRYSDDLFAMLGSLVLVSVGIFVSRTIAGFVDTDAYNIFFPLTIVAFLIYAFVVESTWLTVLLSAIAGLLVGIFLWVWGSGWFIFVFISGALIGYLGYILVLNLYQKLKPKEFLNIIKNDLWTLVSFIVSSTIFAYLIIGHNIFQDAFNGIMGSTSKIATVGASIWPNVYSSVAELNPASFSQIISAVGGSTIFIIALFGAVFLILDFISKDKRMEFGRRAMYVISAIWFLLIITGNFLVDLTANHAFLFLALLFLPVGISLLLSLLNKNKSEKLFLAVLLSIWMAGTIYMSLNGVRFILLLVPAFAISFGIGLYYISKIINNFFIKEFSIVNPIKKVLPGFIVAIILFLTLFGPIYSNAMNISNNTTPNFDDAWYAAMHKIQNDSAPNAIITSWWDFGHFFTAVAQRGVTFDGSTQTTPQAYWVGKILLENNDKKATGILRMLVCGGNNAFNTAMSYTNGTNLDAVKVNRILNQTFGENISTTRSILENNKYYSFTSAQIDSIMKNLDCKNPPEDYFITSQDMIGKAGVWAHWGSWDFSKKYIYDNYKTLTPSQIAQNIDENVSVVSKYVDQLKAIDVEANQKNIKRSDLVNQWLAPYPSYIPIQNNYQYPCVQQNNTITCQNGMDINLQSAKITSQFGPNVVFKRLIFPNQLGNISTIPINQNGTYDALLIPTAPKKYNLEIMQYPLGGSLFTKLYYLHGYGINNFKLFDQRQSVTGNQIFVWKVDWNASPQISNPLSSLNLGNLTINANSSQVRAIVGNSTNISTLNSSNSSISNTSNNSK